MRFYSSQTAIKERILRASVWKRHIASLLANVSFFTLISKIEISERAYSLVFAGNVRSSNLSYSIKSEYYKREFIKTVKRGIGLIALNSYQIRKSLI